VVNDPAAETGDGGTQNQALPEEIQARLKEIFAWLKRMLETKSEMLIILKKCSSPLTKTP
jgi:hypothetical protein